MSGSHRVMRRSQLNDRKESSLCEATGHENVPDCERGGRSGAPDRGLKMAPPPTDPDRPYGTAHSAISDDRPKEVAQPCGLRAVMGRLASELADVTIVVGRDFRG